MAAVSPWAQIIDDTIERIVGAEDGAPLGFTPTLDPLHKWRRVPRARAEGESGRTRELVARNWVAEGEVQTFGGGEDQLSRVLDIDVWYTTGPDIEDLRHSDEQDLIRYLEPRTTYPSGTTWSLMVRRVVREQISMEDGEAGAVKVTYPIRLIWREATSHV